MLFFSTILLEKKKKEKNLIGEITQLIRIYQEQHHEEDALFSLNLFMLFDYLFLMRTYERYNLTFFSK